MGKTSGDKAGKTSGSTFSPAMIGQFQKTLNSSQKFIEAVERTTKAELAKIKTDVTDLRKIVRKEANHSRAYNLVIRGLEPALDSDEKLKDYVVNTMINGNILKNHPQKVPVEMIDEVHRKVGDRSNPPAVMVSFVKLNDKKRVVSNLRHLDGLNKERSQNQLKKLSVSQHYEPGTDAKHRYLKRLQGALNRVKKIPYKDMKVKINQSGEPVIHLEGNLYTATEIPDHLLAEGMTRFGVPRFPGGRPPAPPLINIHPPTNPNNQPVNEENAGASTSQEEMFVDAQ